jgi:hypothetical protein
MEGNGQLHALVTHWIGGRVDPRTGLIVKRKSLYWESNSDPSVVQPVALSLG